MLYFYLQGAYHGRKEIHDSETKIHLIQCAKKEFMEKGFVGASLRGICQKAGVTTGALYFFFQDKDDLFCEVVGNFMDRLNVNSAGAFFF